MDEALYKDIAKHKEISNEKTLELLKKYKATGDSKYRNDIVNGYLKLAVYQATQIAEPWALDDLISEAMLGLVLAVDKFNPKFKVKFSMYALYWMRRQIFLFLKKSNKVPVPSNMKNKYKKQISEFKNKYSRSPEIGDIMEMFECSRYRAYEIQRIVHGISVDWEQLKEVLDYNHNFTVMMSDEKEMLMSVLTDCQKASVVAFINGISIKDQQDTFNVSQEYLDRSISTLAAMYSVGISEDKEDDKSENE